MKFLFTLVVLVGFFFVGFAVAQEKQVVRIETHNPYSLTVKLEVKCDYDWKTKNYKYYENVLIKGKKDVTLLVPNSLKRCEIWPKIIW